MCHLLSVPEIEIEICEMQISDLIFLQNVIVQVA